MRAQEAKENNQDVTVATEVREDVAAMASVAVEEEMVKFTNILKVQPTRL